MEASGEWMTGPMPDYYHGFVCHLGSVSMKMERHSYSIKWIAPTNFVANDW